MHDFEVNDRVEGVRAQYRCDWFVGLKGTVIEIDGDDDVRVKFENANECGNGLNRDEWIFNKENVLSCLRRCGDDEAEVVNHKITITKCQDGFVVHNDNELLAGCTSFLDLAHVLRKYFEV